MKGQTVLDKGICRCLACIGVLLIMTAPPTDA